MHTVSLPQAIVLSLSSLRKIELDFVTKFRWVISLRELGKQMGRSN